MLDCNGNHGGTKSNWETFLQQRKELGASDGRFWTTDLSVDSLNWAPGSILSSLTSVLWSVKCEHMLTYMFAHAQTHRHAHTHPSLGFGDRVFLCSSGWLQTHDSLVSAFQVPGSQLYAIVPTVCWQSRAHLPPNASYGH